MASTHGKDPFEYQKPNERGVADIQAVREGCRQLAAVIEQHVPPSRERALAITNLEQVSMWANKAIVFYPVEE